MNAVPFYNVALSNGFWAKRLHLNRTKTIRAIYERYTEVGRIGSFACDWQEGTSPKPHWFWDSDVAKWIEAVAYMLHTAPDSDLEEKADWIIDQVQKNQQPDGYFNIYFLQFERELRFRNRTRHELYCAGHLIEAAIAYYKATGKRKLLDCMERYVEYIHQRFVVASDTGFITPGHQEIELALIKMYELTGDTKHLELAAFFLDHRGYNLKEEGADPYMQAHLPVREQREAVGHCVRAMYMYCAMADLARIKKDAALLDCCKALFQDVVNHKMFITGGIGSNSKGEAFAPPYYLPNTNAYTETCAGIAFALFCMRMQQIDVQACYGDVIERLIYNGIISGISLEGDAFFYENPLEIHPEITALGNMHYPVTQRQKDFTCSCCPPNIARFIASIGQLFYAVAENNTLYVHQFGTSSASFMIDGQIASIDQRSEYPSSGVVALTYHGPTTKIAIRVPAWSDFTSPDVNKDGYLYRTVQDGECIAIDFGMRPRLIQAHNRVYENSGRVAVMYGPTLYCMEAVDNGENLRDIRIDRHAQFDLIESPEYGPPVLKTVAKRSAATNEALYHEVCNKRQSVEATFIPYFAFSNRGESEMQVWTLLE